MLEPVKKGVPKAVAPAIAPGTVPAGPAIAVPAIPPITPPAKPIPVGSKDVAAVSLMYSPKSPMSWMESNVGTSRVYRFWSSSDSFCAFSSWSSANSSNPRRLAIPATPVRMLDSAMLAPAPRSPISSKALSISSACSFVSLLGSPSTSRMSFFWSSRRRPTISGGRL